MNYSVIIVAAGKSTRFGHNQSKIMYQFPDGQRVIDRTLHLFLEDEDCRQIIVVTNEMVQKYLEGRSEKLEFCAGGESRQESVRNGLRLVREQFVLVHDGARCFLMDADLENLKKEINEEQGALLVKGVTDTVKIAEDGYVSSTVDRNTVKRAQTPQGFATAELRKCYDKAFEDGYIGTDDCSLVERYGSVRIKCVESQGENIKITVYEDVLGGK